MLFIISGVTTALAVLVIVAQVIIMAYLLLLLTGGRVEWAKKIREQIERYGLTAAFIVSIVSVSGSLFYSEYAQYNPCLLCWFQRIAIFPQVFLLLVATIRRDAKALFYVLPISLVGLLIGVYHFSVQMLATYTAHDAASLVPCETVGMTPSCVEYYVIKFGYITIPMMSITALLAMSLGVIAYYRFRKRTD